MLPGFYLFLIDRYLRFLQSQQEVRMISARVLTCEAVELNFSKNPGLSYNPRSSIFVKHLQASMASFYRYLKQHDTLVMISGGSGITPFSSILRELLFATSIRNCRTKQVLLITASKKSVDLTMLDLLLPVSGTTYDTTRLPLRIEAYVTREKVPTTDNEKLCQTTWFKPSAMDAPVSAILHTQLDLVWSDNCIIICHISSAHWHSYTILHIPRRS
ncbi:ferric reduction oxidase 3 [Actinidia rufa]|uniref:Ferric reduction oxidase 3 n=1 Tax=Actinidia rufa TaxID=165716 RepID=A0A7J0DDW8_9ERIC|nr:ferric reduction oxidase 3 [Actinidia rufa]